MIEEKIESDLKQAARAGNALVVSTLRLLKSAIHNAEIGTGARLSEEEVIKILTKEAKQRREAAASYTQGGRPQSAQKEQEELTIIEGYLPAMMSDQDIRKLVLEVISGLESPDFGLVMAEVMKGAKGRADGARVAEIVREETEKSE